MELSWAQWTGLLHLATMWQFTVIRDFVITKLNKHVRHIDPFELIYVGRKCDLKDWVIVEYAELCHRARRLSPRNGETYRLVPHTRNRQAGEADYLVRHWGHEQ